MKCSEKCDYLLPLGVVSRQLQSALDRLGSGVSVINTMRTRHWRYLRQSLRQGYHALVIEVGARHMYEFTRLFLNGSYHFRMTMTGRCHGNARGKVVELVTIDIFDHDPAPALGNQGIRSCVGRGNIFVVARENALGIRARNRSFEFRAGSQSLGGHGILQ